VTERRFSDGYRVRFDEAGADGALRSSGYLRYAQDLAWRHSDAAGFHDAWYRERGLRWLVRALELDIVAPAPYGEPVHVSTEVIGWRRVWARRRSEVRLKEHEGPAAVALIDWVLLDAAGRPTRVPAEIADFFSGEATFTPIRVELGEPDSSPDTRSFEVRPQELDPLDHVNNAAYLDYIEEHLLAAGVEDARGIPRRYRVEYRRSAEPGESIVSTAWPEGRGWSVRLAGEGGRELVRARLEADPADWVGG
jgi:acyl-ACP thioesterase